WTTPSAGAGSIRPRPSSVPVYPVYQVMIARSSVRVTSSRFTGDTESLRIAAAATPLSSRRRAKNGEAAATAVHRRKSRRVKSQPGTIPTYRFRRRTAAIPRNAGGVSVVTCCGTQACCSRTCQSESPRVNCFTLLAHARSHPRASPVCLRGRRTVALELRPQRLRDHAVRAIAAPHREQLHHVDVELRDPKADQ